VAGSFGVSLTLTQLSHRACVDPESAAMAQQVAVFDAI